MMMDAKDIEQLKRASREAIADLERKAAARAAIADLMRRK